MVLGLLVGGASSKEVARDLGISPRTADFHRANIIEKLGQGIPTTSFAAS
jgi:DNA-binding CsgD family transcriptional regulator